jgi:hypothetical protein
MPGHKGGARVRRADWLALAVLVAILAALVAKPLLVSVPPVRTQAAAGAFDAGRAKARLARILGDQRPHPVDSAADDAVRERLIGELRTLGLRPVVRDQTACNAFDKSRLVSCARVRNVIAAIGPPTGKALLLSAHYDSTPVGPGAADAGVGVATLLEVAALLRQRRLQRPVLFLFNEGEELGLLGARAFLADPASRNVEAMLNFEARGVTGAVTMFETSRPNASAVAALGAVERPFASSLMTDVYRLMPNDTDVSIFRERGWLTLNFAMVGNETRYHSAGDNLGALDPRSLQHMGDQALAAATRLSAGNPASGGNRIFIDVLGRGLVQMPLAAGLVLLAGLVVGFGLVAWRRRALVRQPAAVLLAIVLAAGVAWLASAVMGELRVGSYWRAHPEWTFLAIYASALLGVLLSLRSMGAGSTREQLRAAFWLVFLLLGAGLATVAPGAIIYFLFPPLAMLIGVAAGRWHRSAEPLGAVVALVLLYVTWGEMLTLLEALFSPGPLWIVAPLGSLLMIPALIELEPVLSRAARRAILTGSALLALAGWVVAGTAPAYSSDRQQIFTIEHVTSVPERRPRWSVLNDLRPLPDGFRRGLDWALEELPHSKSKRWTAPAPPASLAPPEVQVVGRATRGHARAVRLRLRTHGAERVMLTAPADAAIRAAGIAGHVRPLKANVSDGRYFIRCSGRSCDGQVFIVVIGKPGPVPVTLVGMRNGLPAAAAPLLDARPDVARPQYTPDQTVAVAKVEL